MYTYVGLLLYWRPKLLFAAIVGAAAAIAETGFWTMPVPKILFLYALVWFVLFELVARIGRALADGWEQNGFRGSIAALLYALGEALILYFAYAFVVGMSTLLVATTVEGGASRAIAQGVQLFFIIAIGATQLIMGLAHIYGSREEARAWLRGLKRNWSIVEELKDEIPTEAEDTT